MFKDILLPINISDPVTWEKPLETAIYLARSCGARLHVMTVVPSFDYPTVESFFPVGFEEKAHATGGQGASCLRRRAHTEGYNRANHHCGRVGL